MGWKAGVEFQTAPKPALGQTQPPTQREPGALYQAARWPEHKAHSSLFSAYVKSDRAIYIFTECCLIT
jgi:hypothetical protein